MDHDHDEHRSDQGQADLGTLSVELVAVVDPDDAADDGVPLAPPWVTALFRLAGIPR